MLHKLLLATIPAGKKKREKDYRQVTAVAKRIYADEKLLEETQQILSRMKLTTLRKVNRSLAILQEYTILDAAVVFVLLESWGLNNMIQSLPKEKKE
jgi:hypothetical protein